MAQPNQRARHSTKRSGCDCLNRSPELGTNPQGGFCEFCDAVNEGTGTGTGQRREAPCFFVVLFGCDHYTNDTEREHVAVPCVVLRKRCIKQECIWDSRWFCEDSNPTNDQPALTMEQCYSGQSGSVDGYAEFQPCRDVLRCGGQLHVVTDPVSLQDLCVFDTQFRINCCTFYWIFDDVQIRELCPEFADTWANVDSRDVGQVARCCYCEDAESLASPGISGDECGNGTFGTVICPHNRDSGTPDWDCCNVSTVYDVDPYGVPPYSYVVDCVMCRNGEVAEEEDYEAFFKDPTSYCNGTILHRGFRATECAWAEDPCTGPDNCASPGTEFREGTGTGGDEVDQLDCFTKWELEATSSTTAVLRGRSRRGYYANYVCNDWSCYERRTFTMQPGAGGDYSPEMTGLPLCVCVAPHGFRQAHCHGFGQLACCDSGGDTLNVRIQELRDCDDNLILNDVNYPFIRGMPLPCGVANPFPNDPCFYFAAIISVDSDCVDWGGSVLVVMYCSRNTPTGAYTPACPEDPTPQPSGQFRYDFAFYCLNMQTSCWEFRSAFCGDYDCTCQGPNPPAFSYTKECCCEEVPLQCCGEELIPTVITVEITSSCSWLNGSTGTLTYNASGPSGPGWYGTVPTGGMDGATPIVLDVHFSNAEVCNFNASYIGGCTVGFGGEPTTLVCSPFLAETPSSDFSSFDLNCDSCTTADTVTVTFTE